MGCNYYVLMPRASPCGECGSLSGHERLHIGKSSGGWAFKLHVMPERGIDSYYDWVFVLRHNRIVDEYGASIDADDMLDLITETPIGYERKRHDVDGVHCIGHGHLAYDLFAGDFS